jgi:hypothetical protein
MTKANGVVTTAEAARSVSHLGKAKAAPRRRGLPPPPGADAPAPPRPRRVVHEPPAEGTPGAQPQVAPA